MSRWPSSTDLYEWVLEHGLDAVGIAPMEPSQRADALRQWVACGYHADMAWFATRIEDRLNPARRYPDVQSWLVAAASYYTEVPPAAIWQDPRRGRLARYTWGPDYHAILRDRLGRVAERIRQLAGLTERPRVAVDTMPILERELAELAGLGFIGRNALLIHTAMGSWVHLGAIGLPWRAEPLGPARIVPEGCGLCRRCRDACPTGAIVADRIVDARRCIAWMTVECAGAIPSPYRRSTQRWLVGCDLCQECCPWNLPPRVRVGRAPWLAFDPELHAPKLTEALSWSETEFAQRYAGTVVARVGWRRWIRNTIVAASAQFNDPEIRTAVVRHSDSPDPLIREHVRWFESLGTADEPAG